MENLMQSGILPWVMIIVVFYFFMLRPKQKEAKEREQMLEALKTGDKVSTSSGIIGVITKLGKENFTLKTGESKIEFSRIAIQQKLSSDSKSES